MLRYKVNLLRNIRERKEGETSADESTGRVRPIDVNEIKNAETEILRYVQGQSFQDECQLLNGNNQPKKKHTKEMQQNI